MKNRRRSMFVLGMLALTFGIIAAGCDNGTTSTTSTTSAVSLGETVNESGIQVYDGSGNTYSGSNVSFTHYRSIGGGGDQNATLTTVGISNQTASSGKLTLTLDHPPPPPAACSLPVEA